MGNLDIQSVRGPFDDPGLASRAIAALSRADAMGLLSRRITCLDGSAMEQLVSDMLESGIGQDFIGPLRPLSDSGPARLSVLLDKVNEALDQSPAPAREWRVLQRVLGLDLLVRLLDISHSSARRYLSGARSTPDIVAGRWP